MTFPRSIRSLGIESQLKHDDNKKHAKDNENEHINLSKDNNVTKRRRKTKGKKSNDKNVDKIIDNDNAIRESCCYTWRLYS